MIGSGKEGWLGPRTALLMVGRALRTRTLWLCLPLALLMAAAILGVVRPVYRSDVVLLYRPPPGATIVSQTEGDSSRQLAARLKEMLFTRGRLTGLLKDLNLYHERVTRTGLSDAIEEIRKHLKFDSSGGETFRISFEDESPQQAQTVAARTADILLDVHRQWRLQDVVNAQHFFDVQKRVAEDALREREAELGKFVGQHPEMALALGNGPMTPGAQLRAVSAESRLSAPDASVFSLEARATRLREHGSELPKPEKPSAGEVATAPLDPTLQAEREAAEVDLVAARRDLAQKQKQFTSAYPDVRQANEAVMAARERLRKIDDAMAAAKKGAALPPSADLSLPRPTDANPAPDAATRRRLAALSKQIAQARARALERDPKRLAELGTQLAELDRRASEARDRLAVLQSKQFQASLQATLDLQDKTGELVVVDPAFLPARAERRGRVKMGALGAGAALALVFGLSLAVVFFDDRLRAELDFARLGLPPLLAEVPRESRRGRGSGSARRRLARRTS